MDPQEPPLRERYAKAIAELMGSRQEWLADVLDDEIEKQATQMVEVLEMQEAASKSKAFALFVRERSADPQSGEEALLADPRDQPAQAEAEEAREALARLREKHKPQVAWLTMLVRYRSALER